MNKKFFGFISVLAFSLIFIFSFVNISNALSDVNISADSSNITTDSVVLEAFGSITPGTYNFSVYEESGYPENRNKREFASGPESYTANAFLSRIAVTLVGLKPSTRYVAVVYKDNYNDVSEVRFATIDDPNSGTETITLGAVTTTSVEITVSGLSATDTYQLYVSGDTGKTPSVSYEQNKNVSSSSGKVTFNGLTANNNYVAYLVKNGNNNYKLGRQYFVAKVTSASNNPSVSNTPFSGIVPTCNVGTVDPKTGKFPVPCDFNFFMKLLNSIIKFLLFTIATPLIALIIMYTGYLYLTAGGNTGQVEKVKHVLFSAVIGYVVALAAWLIVNTILSSFGVDSSVTTFLK